MRPTPRACPATARAARQLRCSRRAPVRRLEVGVVVHRRLGAHAPALGRLAAVDRRARERESDELAALVLDAGVAAPHRWDRTGVAAVQRDGVRRPPPGPCTAQLEQLVDGGAARARGQGDLGAVVVGGQQILASQADIPSIRNDIEGKNDIDGMTKMLGNALKPIPVDETLLEYLEPKKRLEFIKQWRTAAAK